jgi:hypothetical protein
MKNQQVVYEGASDMAPTRDPVNGLGNLNVSWGIVGLAIFGNFLHIHRTFCQFPARSVKI